MSETILYTLIEDFIINYPFNIVHDYISNDLEYFIGLIIHKMNYSINSKVFI